MRRRGAGDGDYVDNRCEDRWQVWRLHDGVVVCNRVMHWWRDKSKTSEEVENRWWRRRG